jgi:hypothetical protein
MVLAALTASRPAGAALPPTPAGWNLIFSDDFNGPAGQLPSSQNWLFDLGTSYPGGAPNWGTGEVETMTNNPANVSLDGGGNLRITPLRAANGSWTSARIETRRTDFAAPGGGKMRVEGRLQQPNVSGAAALGYWPAFWSMGAAARPVGATTTTAPTQTTAPPGRRNAYATIQAGSYNQQSGIQTEATSDSGGGQNIGWIANGDWALYSGVDFGSTPARQFSARVASGAAGGVSGLVQVRLDSLTSPPVGDFAVANTGGWQSWRTVPANISAITGVHNVYLTFSSGQPADFVNVNWFTFGH